MKLLFDENLSPKLPKRLADLFPQSTHVHACGLAQTDDRAIWEFAREQGFVIVSKDADFQALVVLRGAPPKLVHLQSGNASARETENLSRRHVGSLLTFEADPDLHCLILV